MSDCPICAKREPADGLVICAVCMGRLDDDLARIVELTALAAHALTPQTRPGNGGHTVPGSRPPLSLEALDACIGNDVLPILEDWIRLTRSEASLAPYGAATAGERVTVAGSVAFLRSWLLWACERVDWPIEDYAREVRDLRGSLERFDPDRDDERGMRLPCTGEHPDHDGRECGYRLKVDGLRVTDDVECRRCGNVTTTGRLIMAALSDPEVTVWAYPDVIEATLGIPTRTLRRWGNDGTVGRNGSRYDVGACYRRRMSA